jgi:hypothetical protein
MTTAENISKWRDQLWKCSNCGFVLGVVSNDGSSLRIKWRDLFIEIVDARIVRETCRRCGLTNELTGDGPGICATVQSSTEDGK